MPSFETMCLAVLTVLTASGLWALWPVPGTVSEVRAEQPLAEDTGAGSVVDAGVEVQDPATSEVPLAG